MPARAVASAQHAEQNETAGSTKPQQVDGNFPTAKTLKPSLAAWAPATAGEAAAPRTAPTPHEAAPRPANDNGPNAATAGPQGPPPDPTAATRRRGRRGDAGRHFVPRMHRISSPRAGMYSIPHP